MYNYYRWFPDSKVVFVAPTRPLATQQIEACFHIMGAPRTDMVLLIGTVHAQSRHQLWSDHRMVFATPHIVRNDINLGLIDPRRIVCLVVDEAHRARGNHAYCTLVREIAAATSHFRLLALSATPGSKKPEVQVKICIIIIFIICFSLMLLCVYTCVSASVFLYFCVCMCVGCG